LHSITNRNFAEIEKCYNEMQYVGKDVFQYIAQRREQIRTQVVSSTISAPQQENQNNTAAEQKKTKRKKNNNINVRKKIRVQH